MSTTPRSVPRPPLVLWVAVLLVIVEVGAMLTLAIGLVGEVLSDTSNVPMSALGIVAILVAFGVVLLIAAMALLRGRRWGRAPVLTWQLLVVTVAFAQSDVLGVPMTVFAVVAALTVCACVLVPPARRWTGGTHSSDPLNGRRG